MKDAPVALLDQRVLAGTSAVELFQASSPTEVEAVRVYNASGGAVTFTLFHDPSGGGTYAASTTTHLVSVNAGAVAVIDNQSCPIAGLSSTHQLGAQASAGAALTVTTYGRVHRGVIDNG